MPEKPTAPKKKAKTSAPKRAPKAASSGPKTKAAKRDTTYYVTPPEFTVIVSELKPTGSPDARQFASFEGARRAAIDVLVQAIEDAEAKLLTLRRASDYDEWKSVDGAK